MFKSIWTIYYLMQILEILAHLLKDIFVQPIRIKLWRFKPINTAARAQLSEYIFSTQRLLQLFQYILSTKRLLQTIKNTLKAKAYPRGLQNPSYQSSIILTSRWFNMLPNNTKDSYFIGYQIPFKNPQIQGIYYL